MFKLLIWKDKISLGLITRENVYIRNDSYPTIHTNVLKSWHLRLWQRDWQYEKVMYNMLYVSRFQSMGYVSLYKKVWVYPNNYSYIIYWKSGKLWLNLSHLSNLSLLAVSLQWHYFRTTLFSEYNPKKLFRILF